MEDREPGIQPPKTLAGKYRACLQLERESAEEPLPAGTDIGFHEAALRIFLLKEKRDKENTKKYIF
ncbi:MAG: hypothetical protein SO016_12110 [Lachnospiraceae bacterium]|nr:hypothetical protein [Lachnospiraceae bacterium]